METKLSQLVDFMRREDWPSAIKFAAKFPQLGDEKSAITRAKDALIQPDFYRQIKRNPEELVEAGRAALLRRYGRALQG